MNSYWSRRLAHLVPYVPGEQPEEGSFIKLNTNENPYPPSPSAGSYRRSSGQGAAAVSKPECGDLRDAIAGVYGLGPEQVFVGNGSDEVLALAFLAFFAPEDRIAFPKISLQLLSGLR